MRETIRAKVLDQSEILQLIKKLSSLRDQAFLCCLYLTGARVSEAIQIKTEDVHNINGLTVIDVFTLKRKKGVPIRKIPLPKESEMTQIFLQWIEQCKKLGAKYVFHNAKNVNKPIKRCNAWKIVKKADAKLFPHLFRHYRLSHLAEKMNPSELMQFAGWSNLQPSGTYIHLSYQLLAKKV